MVGGRCALPASSQASLTCEPRTHFAIGRYPEPERQRCCHDRRAPRLTLSLRQFVLEVTGPLPLEAHLGTTLSQ
jgi:hypothetical protein